MKKVLMFAVVLAFGASPAMAALYDVIVDDDQAVFMDWGGGLIQASGDNSYNGSYHYVANWGGTENPAARVRYPLPGIPSGERIYNVYAWSPTAHSNQWHAVNVAADGTENFNQQISWAGQFGTNKQWIAFDAQNQGGWVQLGPGPQTDPNADGGLGVYITGDHQQPYLYVEYQPWFGGDIAFDAIRVVEVPEPAAAMLLLAGAPLLLRRKRRA